MCFLHFSYRLRKLGTFTKYGKKKSVLRFINAACHCNAIEETFVKSMKEVVYFESLPFLPVSVSSVFMYEVDCR